MIVQPELSPRPLRDTERDRRLFVNRGRELAIAMSTLGHGGNVLVLGSRGSGKSSLLSYLAADLRGQGDRWVAVIDGRAASSTRELLLLLRDALGAWRRVPLGSAVSTVADGAKQLALSPELVLRPPTTETQLLLDELAQMRLALDPEQQVIACIDEMPSSEVARVLFGRMRDELWELPITWCVAADDHDRSSFIEPPADAFWTRVIELGHLSTEDGEELLMRRLGPDTLPRPLVKRIVEESEGNPRRIVSLAHGVLSEASSPDEVLASRAKRDQTAQGLGSSAARLVAELEAGGPASPSDAWLLQSLGWTRSRAAQVFSQLEKAGLVRASTRRSGPGRPRRVFELVDS